MDLVIVANSDHRLYGALVLISNEKIEKSNSSLIMAYWKCLSSVIIMNPLMWVWCMVLISM